MMKAVRSAYVAAGLIGILTAHAASAQLVVAHRGASAAAPENTLAAFRLAWELGADAAEGDFRLSSDGTIVCCHDQTTERTGKRPLFVAESTFEELRALDVGSWKSERFAGEQMPTLSDVLATVPSDRSFYIEVKCGPEILPALAEVIGASGLATQQVRVIAFDKEVIREAKRKMPEREAYWLVSLHRDKSSTPDRGAWKPTLNELIAVAHDIGADGLDLRGVEELIDEAFVTACREAGLSVHVWTIDDPAAAVAFARAGVASITTNHPDKTADALAIETVRSGEAAN